jgi:putative ABC transport system permease protein
MLTGDFMKLVIVAIVIGSPVAWWAVDRWLDDFAYRIPVGWWIFAVAGCIAVLIALISTSFLALKTATANPLKNLRAD